MKRSLISLTALAVIALSTQAFAIDKPADGKQREAGAANNLNVPGLIKPNTTAATPSKPQTPASAPAPVPVPVPVTKLTAAKFLSLDITALEQVQMKFEGINLGAGKVCGGKVVWGDGTTFDNMLADSGAWRTINQVFAKAGNYTATVTPKSFSGNPCISDAPITVAYTVKPPKPLPPSTMTKLVVTPVVNPMARLISTKWSGGGNPKAMCSYTLHFGDGSSKKTAAGPIQPGSDEQHTYAAPGTYSVLITPNNTDYDSCSLGPDAGPKTFTVQ